jgi:hypothetical protein
MQGAADVRQDLVTFLRPLLLQLDAQLDRRVVDTFARTIDAILCFRNRPHGLLLSELGGYLLSPAHAAAGTTWLSNSLRSTKWAASMSEDFLWQQATTQLEALERRGEQAVVLWDESLLEKPESSANPDLGSVRSAKAHRLTRIKPGFQWIGLLLAGMTGTPRLAAVHWWINRRDQKSDKRTEEGMLPHQTIGRWGQRVCHVFD